MIREAMSHFTDGTFTGWVLLRRSKEGCRPHGTLSNEATSIHLKKHI